MKLFEIKTTIRPIKKGGEKEQKKKKKKKKTELQVQNKENQIADGIQIRHLIYSLRDYTAYSISGAEAHLLSRAAG